MDRFKNIAVIIDPNNSIPISQAENIKKINNANLTGLLIIYGSKEDPLILELKKNIAKKYSFIDKIVLIGQRHIINISSFCNENNIDLIISSSKEENNIRKFFYGSLNMSIIRKINCPVWITNDNNQNNYKKILISIKPKEEDEESSLLNDKLIQIGTSLAKRHNAECMIVACWWLLNEGMLNNPFLETPQEDIDELKSQEKFISLDNFEKIQERNKDLIKSSEIKIIEGRPQSIIPSFIIENEIDIIIMGTLSHSGVKGFVIGNVAEDILNQVECSLIAVKPDGFKSPLL